MSSPKNVPRGYFEKILALDSETTGLAYNSDDPSYDPVTGKTYQSVAWGFIVADAETLKSIEELYVEIQWDGESEWNTKAEAIHGLSREHLKKNGLTAEQAVEVIGDLIIRHWGPTNSIRTLGHNVVTFDLWFLKRLFRKFDIELKFGNRHVDTSSIGFVNWKTFNSDDLFDVIGMPTRGEHNALDDARFALEAARRTRVIFQHALEN